MRKVNIRIAVCIDKNGNWNSSGWATGDDLSKMEVAAEGVEEGANRYWIETELPVPEDIICDADTLKITKVL